MRKINFTYHLPGCDRIHSINQEDGKTVLERLPEEIWLRLKAVHFNDAGAGRRGLSYVMNQGRDEISICALPPRISLASFLSRNESPKMFGAIRGCQWPRLAVRRFMLYKKEAKQELEGKHVTAKTF